MFNLIFMYHGFPFNRCSLVIKDETVCFFWGERYDELNTNHFFLTPWSPFLINTTKEAGVSTSIETISAASCISFGLTIWHSCLHPVFFTRTMLTSPAHCIAVQNFTCAFSPKLGDNIGYRSNLKMGVCSDFFSLVWYVNSGRYKRKQGSCFW